MKLYDRLGNEIGELYDMSEPGEVDNATEISDNGIELIKSFEGFRSNPYYDSVGVPTIGYGTTRYLDGTKVSMSDKPISKDEATALLKKQVSDIYGKAVNDYKTIDTNQNQFDAMTSLCYNIGTGAFKSSTLLKKHNAGDFKGAADEFLRWVYAGGQVLQGLVNRREKEREIYLS